MKSPAKPGTFQKSSDADNKKPRAASFEKHDEALRLATRAFAEPDPQETPDERRERLLTFLINRTYWDVKRDAPVGEKLIGELSSYMAHLERIPTDDLHFYYNLASQQKDYGGAVTHTDILIAFSRHQEELAAQMDQLNLYDEPERCYECYGYGGKNVYNPVNDQSRWVPCRHQHDPGKIKPYPEEDDSGIAFDFALERLSR